MAKISKLSASLFLCLPSVWLVYGIGDIHISIPTSDPVENRWENLAIECYERDAATAAELRKWCPPEISGLELIDDGFVLRYLFSDNRCPIGATTIAYSVAMQDHVRTLGWKQFVTDQIQAVIHNCVIDRGNSGILIDEVTVGTDIVYLLIRVGLSSSTFPSPDSTSDEEPPSIPGQRADLLPLAVFKKICARCTEMATFEDVRHQKHCATAWGKSSNMALALGGIYMAIGVPNLGGFFSIVGNAVGVVPEFINFCNAEDQRDRCVAGASMLQKAILSAVSGTGMYLGNHRVIGAGNAIAAAEMIRMPDLLEWCMAKPATVLTADRQQTESNTRASTWLGR
ncbi:hypothetical protein MMC27_002605 [Xylographa pallens]|nr:hypothetical protein [Xylographa pallens]